MCSRALAVACAGLTVLLADTPAPPSAAVGVIVGQPTAQSVVISDGPLAERANTAMPTGTGLVLGRVIDPAGRQPVPGAIVRLTLIGSATPALGVVSDGQGRFVFRDLPAGRFSLEASKTGYVDGRFGKHLPETGLNVRNDWVPIELGRDQHRGDIVLQLWKHAAIGGAVRIIAPQGTERIGRQVLKHKHGLTIAGAVWLALGAVLCLFGYLR